jgi:MFS family permease
VDYGGLYAVQQAVSIASYLPGGRLADRAGRGPLVAVTFVFFALFPLAVRFATTFPMLVAAFCLGGLKEIGEPARKSLIVDLAPDDQRARAIGAYYGIRNLVVVPAGIAGGLLWQQAPTLPLEVASGVGLAGAAVFAITSLRGRAQQSPARSAPASR